MVRALALLLLAATVSLASRAKNSAYRPHRNSATSLSKVTKMRETPVQGADACQALSRSGEPLPDVSEARGQVPPDAATALFAASTVLSADQLRSPPTYLR
ncbi:MAG TPA: hypothetical protein VG204_01290 [Terriglobia bacterium]|nr:hypothetical protein [Terriglobia bacterium]